MSNSDAKPKLDLDLESAFLPAWAQKSSEENPYAKFEGRDKDFTNRDGRGRNRGEGGGRPPRQRNRDPRNKDRRQEPGGRDGNRQGGGGQRGGASQGRSSGRSGGNSERGGGRNRSQGRGEGRGFHGRGQHRDRPRRSRQEILASLPQLKTQIIPESKGVALLAKRIRLQGRAYPLFDIAGLILQSPERYHIRFTSQTPPKDQEQQKIWICKLDQTVWLDEAEAVQHVLQKHLDDFYSAERTETEPPKGAFNFVAQCGISGIVLGPPNYHGYQARLRELHEERFSRMDFEHFKSKVKIVQDEEVVKKWLDEQSWTTEYADKKNPESDKLHSLDEVEAHFRENYFKDSIECVQSAQVAGDPKTQLSRPIRDLIRFHVDDQTRFPLQLATELSQQFTRQGLQFFKVNKTVTHVSVSRPHYLDLETTPVSDMVKRIVQFIEETPDCTRVKVMENLAPGQPKVEDSTQVASGNDEKAAETENQDTQAEVSEESKTETDKSDALPTSEASQNESTTEEQAKSEPTLTPEQAAVTTDLHWLIHQGHVIEFSNGKLETAKKPKEQPKKKSAKAPQEKAKSNQDSNAAEAPKADQGSTTESSTSTSEVPVKETEPKADKTENTVKAPEAQDEEKVEPAKANEPADSSTGNESESLVKSPDNGENPAVEVSTPETQEGADDTQAEASANESEEKPKPSDS